MSFAKIAPLRAVVLATCIIATGAAAAPAFAQDTARQSISQETETDRLNAWFAGNFEEELEYFPANKTGLGIIDEDYGRWNDISPEALEAANQRSLARLEEMRTRFDFDALDPVGQMSWRLFEYSAERAAESEPFDRYGYVFNQLFGPHTGYLAFLIGQHRIETAGHAEAYIQRLSALDDVMDMHIAEAEYRFAQGIEAPAWVYDRVLSTVQGLQTGAPFDDGPDHPLWADFQRKVGALDLTDTEQAALLDQARTALLEDFGPVYARLEAMLVDHRDRSATADGVADLPDGEAFYNNLLAGFTTTDMTAQEIHALGLAEVDRLHAEMREVMAQTGFEGSLQDFFVFLREDPQFYYPDTDEGREAYMQRATEIIETVRERLPEFFGTLPEAELVVRRVEPFREAGAGLAFYENATPDGSRPAVYYVNLRDMTSVPIYQMATLAYHEGIPGHHLQRSIQQEMENLPRFRQFVGYTAYAEGWGLYAESLPVEMGLYSDPYLNAGRIAMELWRACRLVVDTGLHANGWSREEAIAYLQENTPNSDADIIPAVERYVVFPGQATAYQVGKNHIVALREQAERTLGDAFDVRAFHDTVLASGQIPLSMLTEEVEAWTASVQSAQ
ncbi:DUF885 family protein [Maricaulis sp.]|uniref:DUF885 domain-containing protein n=1 Tax=Maricaulis sp. TaxID=1486257 RepID=UPI001B156D70|nr:DUF885 domain-containing protein [Maricaulis sp.]MBO6765326.1 DUF885 domain-containing protein [Maricaulis sp.]